MKILLALILTLTFSGIGFAGLLDAPTPTRDEIIAEQLEGIISATRLELQRRKEFQTSQFNAFWHNLSGVTAQEFQTLINSAAFKAKYGIVAADLFIASYTNEQQIKAFDPSWEYMVTPYVASLNPQTGDLILGDCQDVSCQP